MDKQHDIKVLNSLIVTTIDSALGFEESAADTGNRRFAGQFRQFALARRKVIDDLQAQVRRLGGTPEEDGSAKAAAHRRWVDFKTAITGASDAAVVSEVATGETHIRSKFEAALEDTDLSPDTRAVIEQGFGSVRAGHFFATRLEEALRGGSTSSGVRWARSLAGVAALAGAAYAANKLLNARRPSQRRDFEDQRFPLGQRSSIGSDYNALPSQSNLQQPSATGHSASGTTSSGSAFPSFSGTGSAQGQDGAARGRDPESVEGSGYAPRIDKSGL